MRRRTALSEVESSTSTPAELVPPLTPSNAAAATSSALVPAGTLSTTSDVSSSASRVSETSAAPAGRLAPMAA